MATTTKKMLECDYLVVGAGAAPLAFVDTLLTELPHSKVILIDKKSVPGGHWVDAYGFVRLHQPSLVYGVASKQLEGNWLRLMATKFTLPWKHRATKQELLTYFDDFVREKVDAKQLEFYPNCQYKFDENETDSNIHKFSSLDAKIDYEVKVNVKVIDGTAGECIIPSQNPLQFPVDNGVRIMTPNQLYDAHIGNSRKSLAKNKYVVLGAGKTAMDSLVFLQRTIKVKPEDIAWVIPNDVWMLRLEGNGNPWSWPLALIDCNGDEEKASLQLEKEGKLARIDENVTPKRFRFPVIPKDELKLLRNIKNTIRHGRATAIRKDGSNLSVEFGDDKPAWKVFGTADQCVFVHATCPGPFNGKIADDLFVNGKYMTINLLTAPPISSSMSTLAKIEAARQNGTLDLDFARLLYQVGNGATESSALDTETTTENDILRWAVRGYKLSFDDNREKVKPIITLAIVFAILDKDPMVALNWMKSNRLTFFSIPNFKGHVYENMLFLQAKGKDIGFSDNDLHVFKLLAEKLKPLEGM